jgi:hypothetical protein
MMMMMMISNHCLANRNAVSTTAAASCKDHPVRMVPTTTTVNKAGLQSKWWNLQASLRFAHVELRI